jgi:hypothetical protein
VAFDAGEIVASLVLQKSEFTRDLAAARSEGAKGIDVPVTFDISQASVARAIAASKRLFAGSPVSVAVNFDISQASVSRALSAARSLFKASPVTVPVAFSVSQASVLTAVRTARALFAANPIVVPVGFSVSQASVARAVMTAKAMFRANPVTIPVNFNTAGAASATAAASKLAGATTSAGNAARGAYGWFRLLALQIPLFGAMTGPVLAADGALTRFLKSMGNTLPHILTFVSAWHLLADWIIEFSAVLIPATIALGVFGVAATGAIRSIVTQLKDASIVSTATGRSIAPLTGAFQKLQDAVQPQVYQLYGDALTIAASKSGALATLATATGHALDYLGARMTVAITSGKSLGGIMAAGSTDVAKLGAVVGNLGGTLGNVLKAVPGYAAIFLNLWVAVTRGLEVLTSVTEPILRAGLALHGLIIYVGLAVTAVLKFGPAVVRAVAAASGAFADFALRMAAYTGVFIGDLIAAEGAMATFTVVTDALAAVNPLVWVGVAVALLGGLVYWMSQSKTATQQFNASLQATIDNAPSIAAATRDITTAQTLTSQKLAAANRALAEANRAAAAGAAGSYAPTTRLTAAQREALSAVAGLRAGSQQLAAENQLSSTRLDALGRTYGSTATAMGLVVTAGITEKQWQDKSANGWAIIRQQVAATALAYKDMGITGGILGNDMQVLNSQASDQYQAIQKLNTGLTTWIGNITATQGAFDTLALGNVTLAANFTKANEAVSKTIHTLGGVKVSSNLAGAAMDGLSQASLTLNQAFGTQITNVNALLDSWRQAGVAQELQTRGTKDAIAPLLKYAQGSREATAQLVALAEEAGYNGPASLKRLTAWLGNTHDATQTVKNITNQATIQEALLTSAMREQGSFIASQLIGDINAAILKYDGVAKAASAYGDAIAKDGRQSDAAHQARQTLIDDLIKSGKAAGDSTTQIAAMITKITGIPLHRALQIVMTGDGSFKIGQGVQQKNPGKGFAPIPTGKAAGGLLRGPGTGTSDSIPAMVSNGEYVVRAAAVDHYGPALLDAINTRRYADGGLVDRGNTSVLTGQYAVAKYNQFTAAMEKAEVAAMRAALARAKAAAAFTGGASGPASPGLLTIAKFLVSHGLTDAAAAGIAGTVAGESGGDPESVGSGGGGLIGWTPISSAYPIQPIITGNVRRDMGVQLTDMLAYLERNGSIADMNQYRGSLAAAMAAAWHWSAQYERPLVTGSDIRSGDVASIYAQIGGHAAGTAGAAPGWAKVGERGQELVHFHGGETVLPNSVTERVLSGTVAMPGYASGTTRKSELASLARKVTDLDRLDKTEAAHVRTLTRPIDVAELYLLEHPHLSPAERKVRQLVVQSREDVLHAYQKRINAQKRTLNKEIALLRALTGYPAGKKYGGGTPGTGTGTGTPPPHALPPPTFLTGAGGAGGFSTAGVTPVSGTTTATAGPVTAAAAQPVASYGPPMAAGDPQVVVLLKSILRQLQAAPAQTSAGVAQGVNGVGRTALNRGYYRVT